MHAVTNAMEPMSGSVIPCMLHVKVAITLVMPLTSAVHRTGPNKGCLGCDACCGASAAERETTTPTCRCYSCLLSLKASEYTFIQRDSSNA
jgi:hypothetical protein